MRNTGRMFVGLGGSSLLQAGCFLLLARLLGVTEYGVFAGAVALVSIVTPYSALGGPMLFMRHVSADSASAQVYWGNTLAATAMTTLLFMVLLAIVGRQVFGSECIALVVILVVSNCFMSQIVTVASVVFQTFERSSATAWLRALSNLLRFIAIAGLMLYLHHATAFQCSLGILAASTLAAAMAFVWVSMQIGRMRFSGAVMRLRFWEGIGFSIAGSTQAVYNDMDKMMLSHYAMNPANGIYSMAYRVVDFATIPVNAIDTACLPRYFSLNNRSLASVGRLARRSIPLGALTGLAAAGCVMLSSPVLIRIVGHGFAASLLAFRWLCWLPALRGIHQLAGGVLTASGRQNYRTVAQLFVAALNLALNILWIPTHGWIGAAWASLASDGVLGVLNLALVFLVTLCANHYDRSNTQAVEAA